ncbi:MAG: signal peptide peptidase SppA [Acidobacteria bacterium]|nr:signal peptide peptidase SppA [Acidobacteriota bacterium]
MLKRGLTLVLAGIGALTVIGALLIAGFIFFALLFGRGPSVPSNAMLVLEVGGNLTENAPTDVVTYLQGGRTPTVRSVVDTLRRAKTDRHVSAVFLKPTGFASPYWGKVQEIRDAVIDFRSSGKPVYAYLENADERNYYLATAADRIFLMPTTTLDVRGVATYALFLRGTFDKIGVVPDMHHIGQYKTAVNTYTEKTYTPAHKEMDEALNRDLFEQIVRGMAQARKKTDAEVRALIDDGPFLADEAFKAGLVDELAYEDQARDRLKHLGKTTLTEVDGAQYAHMPSLGFTHGERIAVIYASGAIVNGDGGFDPLNGETLGSDALIEAIRTASKDQSVKAIVLRIDSPGGSATASDAIWRELTRARDAKPERPLIVSMSDLAASGGYYIAMPGQVIVAQPSTLTGSIGIFGGKLVTGGVYEKLGAHIESTSIGRNAEMESPVRPFNESELREVEGQLRAFYDGFVTKAAASRHMTPEKLDSLAQGRVWTGQQARAVGLVDELGGLDRAVAIAKERAKIDSKAEVELVAYPRAKGFFELVTDRFSGASASAVNAWMTSTLSSEELSALRTLRAANLYRRGEALALMPFVYVR